MKTDRRRKNFNIAMAILLTFMAWMYVIYTTNPSTTKEVKNVPVTFRNMDALGEEGLAVKSINVKTIDVVIEASRSVVSKVDAEDIQASVNLSKASSGENKLRINVVAGANIVVRSKSVDDARVVLEDVAYKEVSCRAEFKDDAPDSTEPYVVSDITDAFTVSGAKSLIDKVDYVSLPLKAHKLSADEKTFNVTPVAKESDGKQVKYVSVSPESAAVTAVSSHVKKVKLNVKVDSPKRDDCQVSYTAPQEIEIKGSKKALNEVVSINAKPVSTAYMTASENIKLEYELPEGIQIANNSLDEVIRIKVVPYVSKTVKVNTDDVVVENLGKKLKAGFSQGSVEVVVTGLAKNVDHLKPEDIDLVVDAKDYDTPGTYDVVPRIKISKSTHSKELNSSLYMDISEK